MAERAVCANLDNMHDFLYFTLPLNIEQIQKLGIKCHISDFECFFLFLSYYDHRYSICFITIPLLPWYVFFHNFPPMPYRLRSVFGQTFKSLFITYNLNIQLFAGFPDYFLAASASSPSNTFPRYFGKRLSMWSVSKDTVCRTTPCYPSPHRLKSCILSTLRAM